MYQDGKGAEAAEGTAAECAILLHAQLMLIRREGRILQGHLDCFDSPWGFDANAPGPRNATGPERARRCGIARVDRQHPAGASDGLLGPMESIYMVAAFPAVPSVAPSRSATPIDR